MLFRFCTRRSVLSATIVVCAMCICIICFMNAIRRPEPTHTGSYVFSNLAIHRHLGNGVYRVDATPVLELAREIVSNDKSSKVSFNEASQCLVVTSTPENLQRIQTRFYNMYRSIGVELKSSGPYNSILSSQTNASKKMR